MANPKKIERYVVSPHPYRDYLDDWVRVYKTRRGAEKRFRTLVNDYEVGGQISAWYPDFSKSKAGRFEVIKARWRKKRER